MTNPKFNYSKILNFCKKQISNNPFIVKAILVHIGIVVFLLLLSYISLIKSHSSNSKLEVEISKKMPKQLQIIQATSISSSELNRQIMAYDDNRKQLQRIRQSVKEAKKIAIEKAQQMAKQKALAALKAKQEEQKRLKEEAKRKEIQNKKALELKKKQQSELEVKKRAEEEAKRKEVEEKKELELKKKQQAELEAKKRAEALAKKQVEQKLANSAVTKYIAQYQDRVGSNWIKDSCRGIYNFPRAIIRDGKFIRLTGTTENDKCDQSLINAIKYTTPPIVTNKLAREIIKSQNISFIFRQT